MLAELRITPVGGRVPFVELVAHLLPALSESPLQYRVHPMGTTLEGDLEAILALVRDCHEELRKHTDRVLIELAVDDRGGSEGELVRGLDHLGSLTGRPLERLVRGGPR